MKYTLDEQHDALWNLCKLIEKLLYEGDEMGFEICYYGGAKKYLSRVGLRNRKHDW